MHPCTGDSSEAVISWAWISHPAPASGTMEAPPPQPEAGAQAPNPNQTPHQEPARVVLPEGTRSSCLARTAVHRHARQRDPTAQPPPCPSSLHPPRVPTDPSGTPGTRADSAKNPSHARHPNPRPLWRPGPRRLCLQPQHKEPRELLWERRRSQGQPSAKGSLAPLRPGAETASWGPSPGGERQLPAQGGTGGVGPAGAPGASPHGSTEPCAVGAVGAVSP